MRGSKFVFDYIQLLYYKSHNINLNHGGSFIDSPVRIKNEKATINPINKKNKECFQYAVTVTLNFEKVKNDPQRIRKTEIFTSKYNWKGINYPSEKMIGKNLRKKNVKKCKICYISKKINI